MTTREIKEALDGIGKRLYNAKKKIGLYVAIAGAAWWLHTNWTESVKFTQRPGTALWAIIAVIAVAFGTVIYCEVSTNRVDKKLKEKDDAHAAEMQAMAQHYQQQLDAMKSHASASTAPLLEWATDLSEILILRLVASELEIGAETKSCRLQSMRQRLTTLARGQAYPVEPPTFPGSSVVDIKVDAAFALAGLDVGHFRRQIDPGALAAHPVPDEAKVSEGQRAGFRRYTHLTERELEDLGAVQRQLAERTKALSMGLRQKAAAVLLGASSAASWP